MEIKKTTNEKLIIMLAFTLLVFHTLTYLQNYYSFVATLAVFTAIVVLAFFKAKGKVDVKKNSSLIFLGFMLFIIVFMGVTLKNSSLITMLGAYLPYVIWPILYLIVDPIMDKKNKRVFLLLFLVVYTISVTATLSVVSVDNDAARLLAGAASDTVRAFYYEQGVGGYGFIYGCVFLLYGLVLWMREEKNIVVKILLLAICIVTFIMIIYASYTTALLLSLILVFLTFYALSNKKYATIVFVVAILLAALLMDPILELIYNLAEQLELDWIAKRIGQLLNAEESGSYGELNRSMLYRRSLNTFWEHMFLGGTKIGGHSMSLDHMGKYGIFGMIFGVAYFAWLNTLRKLSGRRIGFVYVLFAVFLCINTMDTMVLLPMVQLALPLMLSMVSEQSNGEVLIK